MALLLEWERGWQRGEQSRVPCPIAALQTGSGFAVHVRYMSSWVLVRRTLWQHGNGTFCRVICLLGSVRPLAVPWGLRRMETRAVRGCCRSGLRWEGSSSSTGPVPEGSFLPQDQGDRFGV